MTLNLNDLIFRLEAWGLSDIILPFMLIFVAVFVALSKVRMFSFTGKDLADKEKDPNRKFSLVIALVVAAMVVIPHVTGQYPAGKDVVNIINQSIPQIALLLVAGIAIFMVIGLFFNTFQLADLNLGLVLGFLGIVFVIAIFGNAANLWQLPEALSFLEDSDTQSAIVIIAVFGLVIWFITRGGGESGSGQDDGWYKWLFSKHALTP